MQHIRLKHKFMLNSTATCKFDNCSDQFTNVYSLRRHVLNKHSSIISKRINDTVFATNASEISDATSTIPHFGTWLGGVKERVCGIQVEGIKKAIYREWKEG